MMKRCLPLLIVAALGSTAIAGGSWADRTNYRYSNGTSLKVTDPEGFKVVVSLPDGDKADTVPAMFALPDQDTYVKVTLTAPDGTSWSKKIEVRSKQQAELSVQFKADAAAQPASKTRSYVGKFLNEAGGCGHNWKRQIQAQFILGDGTVAKTQVVDPHTYVNLELAAGKYDVRIKIQNGDVWDFVLTGTANIDKDGWNLGFGCQGNKPVLVGP